MKVIEDAVNNKQFDDIPWDDIPGATPETVLKICRVMYDNLQ